MESVCLCPSPLDSRRMSSRRWVIPRSSVSSSSLLSTRLRITSLIRSSAPNKFSVQQKTNHKNIKPVKYGRNDAEARVVHEENSATVTSEKLHGHLKMLGPLALQPKQKVLFSVSYSKEYCIFIFNKSVLNVFLTHSNCTMILKK